jgi:hypothetical protein
VIIHSEGDFDDVFEVVLKTELVTVIHEAYKIATGKTLILNFSNQIKYAVKKTRWQSGGTYELIFELDQASKAVTFKNKGKSTVITAISGLPADSKPANRTRSFKIANMSGGNRTNILKEENSSFGSPSDVVKIHKKLEETRVFNSQSNFSAGQKSYSSANIPVNHNFIESARIGYSQSNLVHNNNLSGSGYSNLNNSNNSLAAVAKRKAPPPPPPKKTPQLRALYNFEAREADELSFNVGDIIGLVSTNDPDWWTGKIGGKTGLFPSNVFVLLI